MKLMLVALAAVALVGVYTHLPASAFAGPDPTPSAIAASPSATAVPSEAPSATVEPTPPPVTRTPPPPPPPSCRSCTISGRVTLTTGQGAPRTHVNVYRASDGAFVGTTLADDNGFYSITVPVGTYKMFFNPAYQSWVPQWFNGRTSLNSANAISVSGPVNISPVLGTR